MQTLDQLLTSTSPTERADFAWILERSALAQHFLENIDHDDDADATTDDDIWDRIGRSGEHTRRLPVCRESSTDVVQFLQTMDGWAIDLKAAPRQFMRLIVGPLGDAQSESCIAELETYKSQIDKPRHALVDRLVSLRERSHKVQVHHDYENEVYLMDKVVSVLYAFSGSADAACVGDNRADEGLLDAFVETWVIADNHKVDAERMLREILENMLVLQDDYAEEIVEPLYGCRGLFLWTLLRVVRPSFPAKRQTKLIKNIVKWAFRYGSAPALLALGDVFSAKKEDLDMVKAALAARTHSGTYAKQHAFSAAFVDALVQLWPEFLLSEKAFSIAYEFRNGPEKQGIDGAIDIMRRIGDAPPGKAFQINVDHGRTAAIAIAEKMVEKQIPWNSEIMDAFIAFIDVSFSRDPTTAATIKKFARNAYITAKHDRDLDSLLQS